MKLLDDYFDLKRQIYEFFGYEDGWRSLPLDAELESFWGLNCRYGVRWADSEEELQRQDYYGGEIYAPSGSTGIWPKDEYTLMAVDTNCDGNIFLIVFSNSKKRDIEDEDEWPDTGNDLLEEGEGL